MQILKMSKLGMTYVVCRFPNAHEEKLSDNACNCCQMQDASAIYSCYKRWHVVSLACFHSNCLLATSRLNIKDLNVTH